LVGPMTRKEWDRVLDEEVIVRNGKKYAWTIPLALPVSRDEELKPGGKAALVDEQYRPVGVIDVIDVYPFDKPRYLKIVYGTERIDHPGARMVLEDPRDMLVGGEITM